MHKQGVRINLKDHEEIYTWLNKYVIGFEQGDKYFTLTKEGKINAYCNVTLNCFLTDFKYPFGFVSGYFTCTVCQYLTSLIGAPKKIIGGFDCSYCYNLTSLIGCPKEVGGDFDCGNCTCLTSFIGCPKEIGGHFDCYECNSLTSLIGFPKKIKGHIDLSYNNFSNHNYSKLCYDKYIAMWFTLLESVSDDDKIEYFNNYKDKVDVIYKEPIIPIVVKNTIENQLKIEKILKK